MPFPQRDLPFDQARAYCLLQSISLCLEGRHCWRPFRVSGGDRVPPQLVTEDLAAYWTGRPATTIRRWAAEGRLTKHRDPARRRNGVLYDLAELPAAERDPDTRELIAPGPTPDAIEQGLLAA